MRATNAVGTVVHSPRWQEPYLLFNVHGASAHWVGLISGRRAVLEHDTGYTTVNEITVWEPSEPGDVRQP